MSLLGLCQHQFRWVRKTSWALEPTPIALMLAAPSPVKCPARTTFVQVRVEGSSTTGQVLLVGVDDDGNPASEVLEFDGSTTGSATRQGCVRLCLTGISTTGFAGDVQVSAKYVGRGGSAEHVNCELFECILANRENVGRGTWPAPVAGAHETAMAKIDLLDVYGETPRVGDLFVEVSDSGDTLATWSVVGVPQWRGRCEHHWELDVKRLDSADAVVRTL